MASLDNSLSGSKAQNYLNVKAKQIEKTVLSSYNIILWISVKVSFFFYKEFKIKNSFNCYTSVSQWQMAAIHFSWFTFLVILIRKVKKEKFQEPTPLNTNNGKYNSKKSTNGNVLFWTEIVMYIWAHIWPAYRDRPYSIVLQIHFPQKNLIELANRVK